MAEQEMARQRRIAKVLAWAEALKPADVAAWGISRRREISTRDV